MGVGGIGDARESTVAHGGKRLVDIAMDHGGASLEQVSLTILPAAAG